MGLPVLDRLAHLVKDKGFELNEYNWLGRSLWRDPLRTLVKDDGCEPIMMHRFVGRFLRALSKKVVPPRDENVQVCQDHAELVRKKPRECDALGLGGAAIDCFIDSQGLRLQIQIRVCAFDSRLPEQSKHIIDPLARAFF